MLSIPDAGWTDFKLKDKSYALSYLTAVPFDWLTQAIHGLETTLPFTSEKKHMFGSGYAYF